MMLTLNVIVVAAAADADAAAVGDLNQRPVDAGIRVY